MRYFILMILFFASLILQSTLFSHLTFYGVKPDLVLFLTVFFALINGPRQGALAGLTGGLLQDLMFGRYIGMNALAKLLVGYVFGVLERKIYKDNILIPMVAVFFGAFLNETIIYLLGLVSGTLNPTGENFSGYFALIGSVIIPSAIYTSLLAPFVYRKFYNSSRKGFLRDIDR